MTDFANWVARAQREIHKLAGWDHSVLLIVRPDAREAAVVHVDDIGAVWGGATRSPVQIERLKRAGQAISSGDEQDITDTIEVWDPGESETASIHELMGSHTARAAESTDVDLVVFMVRDRAASESLTTRWSEGRTVFVAEPLGFTDALLADAASYATEPMLGGRGVKGPLRLPAAPREPDTPAGPSALTRYLRLELPELVEWVEPFDNWLAVQQPPVQVAAWLWVRIASDLEKALEGDDTGLLEEILDDFAGRQDEYWPNMEDVDPEGSPIPAIFAGYIGGIWEDLRGSNDNGAVPRLDALINAAANTAVSINGMSPRWGLAYDISAGSIMLAHLWHEYEGEIAAIAGLAPVLPDIQRLWWLGECLHRQGIVLSGSNSPAFPPDEMECVRLLCRMAANQPTLTLMTQMQRQIPLRADRWMSLTDRSHRAVDQLELPYDPDLALRLANEIRLKRRYALDHVAIVELDELGVDRIILSPEERADDGSNIGVNALVEHRLGAFAVRTVIQTPDGPAREAQEPVTGSGSPTLTFAPAFMTERTMDECSSPLELVVLSAWRDLVVADVREQQYEIEMQRKARGKGRKGRQVEVIRYLPRRVAVRRAERAVREQTGEPTLRRLYPVGAFAKRLPAGQERSAEAAAFAAEIGMPLAADQTVVKPQWRGGTVEERRIAAEATDAPERVWRSWSALDLIRTRGRAG